MKIESHILNEDNEDQFIEFLFSQRVDSDRNSDWFDMLLWQYTFRKYFCWTFSTIDDNIWCIAAAQHHYFPKGVYRVMTRLFVHPQYRNAGGRVRQGIEQQYSKGKNPEWVPSRYLFPLQMEAVTSTPDYKCMIMTMEHINRRRPLHIVSKFFNKNYGTTFKTGSKTCQTFEDKTDWRAWQVYTSTTPNPPLNYMDDEEWKLRFEKPSLSIA